MAQSCLEQRCAPLGNSFLQCPELRVRISKDKPLKKSWALYKVEASRLRRHHSLGGFIPFAYTALPFPDLGCLADQAARKKFVAGPPTSASWSDSEESGSHCASGDRGYASENSTEPSTPQDQDTHAPSCGSAGHKVEDEHVPEPEPAVTTMMIRNLPHNATQIMLLEELDHTGFADLYDFVYMPAAFDAKQSKGYAFINFMTESAASKFGEVWHKSRHCGVRATLLNISPAALQGLEANIKKLAGPRMARIRNPALRPFVREAGATGAAVAIPSGKKVAARRTERRSARGNVGSAQASSCVLAS